MTLTLYRSLRSTSAVTLRCVLCYSILGCGLVGSASVLRAQSWQVGLSGTNEPLLNVSYPSADTAYAYGDTTVLQSTDKGASWHILTTPVPGFISFVTSQVGYLVGYAEKTAYVTTDAGATWSSAFNEHPYAFRIRGVSPDTAFIVGGASISRTTDRGASWTNFHPTWANDLRGIAFNDPLHGIVVGSNATGPHLGQNTASCFTTTDGGESWTQQFVASETNLGDVTYFSDSVCIAVWGSEMIWRSHDAGVNWQPITLPATGLELEGIDGFHSNVIAVGQGGAIFTSGDYGQSWSRSSVPYQTNLYDVEMFDDTSAIAVGVDGSILRTTNAGHSWVHVSPRDSLSVSVYPNPAVSQVTLSYNLPSTQRVSMLVFNSDGEQVSVALTESVQTSGEHYVSIDVSGLNSGAYYLRLISDDYYGVASLTVSH